ncbi:MAG: OmpH family outer membrane protein [Bacteroidales bacterium]|nr:OmpH family outer membrane protein [Bacteroidales bacterium]
MKKTVLSIMTLLILTASGISQRVAYIETDKILEEMPEYKSANEQIDAKIEQWEAEVEAKFKEVEQLYNKYVSEEALYSDDIKKQKQDEIFEVEKTAKEFKDQKFGYDGELNQLQELKLKPLYDRINEAAENIAKENNFDYVFNKSVESNWIYLNEEYNITDLVKSKLGL